MRRRTSRASISEASAAEASARMPARPDRTTPFGGAASCAGLLALAGAATFVSIAVAPGPAGLFGAGLALLALVIAAIDARSFIIPNELNAALLALGLAHAAMIASEGVLPALALALLRGGALGAAFLLLRLGYFYWRGREGLGLGDVKLAAAGGVWLDWPLMPLSVEIAALAALGAVAVASLARRRRFGAGERLPFGLFLAPAIWAGWLAGSLGLSAWSGP